MKKLVSLSILVMVLFACKGPADPGDSWHKVAAPIPAGLSSGVSAAWYIRVPASQRGMARGMLGTVTNDPDAVRCTEAGSVYMFRTDEDSVTQYIPVDFADYQWLNGAAQITCENFTRDHPATPWDYVAVPPLQPPAYVPANPPPQLPPLYIDITDKDNVVRANYPYIAIDNADYADTWKNVPSFLDNLNMNEPDGAPHHAYGGGPTP